MSTPQTIGPLIVTAPCAVAAQIPDVGFTLPCGPVHLYNASKRPVHIRAEAQNTSGARVCDLPRVDQVLQPGKSLDLVALPGSGNSWVVLYLRKRTAQDIALVALGGGALLVTLAGVGIVDLVRMGRERHLQKRRALSRQS